MIGLYFGSIAILYLLLRLWYGNKDTLLGKWYITGASIVFTFIIFELTANLAFYMMTGKWVFAELVSHNSKLWEEHPQLVGVNRKNVSVYLDGDTYTHNSQGWRGEEFDATVAKKRILAIGGSTTYGIGVSDKETWPCYVDSLLGSDYEVINMGVPGYSTIQHIEQAKLYLDDLQPDIILLHAGLNDLRISHLKDIESNYENFQAAGLFASLGQCYLYNLPKLASLRAFVVILQKMGWYPACIFHQYQFEGVMSEELDATAIDIYHRNLQELFGQLIRSEARILLVPQVINVGQYQKFPYQWWIPYIEPSSIEKHFTAFNNETERVSNEMEVGVYITQVENENWEASDFCDAVHLSAEGNLKLAKIVSNAITGVPDLE